MKTKKLNPFSIMLSLALATVSDAQTAAESAQNEVKAEAHAEAHGSGAQSMKQTVTVTSDGKHTIKTTSTERNGVRENKIEVTDAEGRILEGEELRKVLSSISFKLTNDPQASKIDFDLGGKLPASKGVWIDAAGRAIDAEGRVVEPVVGPNVLSTLVVTDNGPNGPHLPGVGELAQEPPQVWLGVALEAASAVLRDQLDLAANEGAVIVVVGDNSPAAKAGLKPNDIILSVDGKKLSDTTSLMGLLKDKQAGDQITLVTIRKAEKSTMRIALEKRPDALNEPSPAKDEEPESAGGVKTEAAELELKNGDSFEEILADPEVPEDFKKSVRDLQQRMKEFEKKHQSR